MACAIRKSCSGTLEGLHGLGRFCRAGASGRSSTFRIVHPTFLSPRVFALFDSFEPNRTAVSKGACAVVSRIGENERKSVAVQCPTKDCPSRISTENFLGQWSDVSVFRDYEGHIILGLFLFEVSNFGGNHVSYTAFVATIRNHDLSVREAPDKNSKKRSLMFFFFSDTRRISISHR